MGYINVILLSLFCISSIISQSVLSSTGNSSISMVNATQIDSCDSKILIYDLIEKKITNDCMMDSLKIGEYYQIKVRNFDPEKYTLILNGKSVQNSTTNTSITSSLSLADLTALTSALGGSSVAGILPVVEKMNSEPNTAQNNNSLIDQLRNTISHTAYQTPAQPDENDVNNDDSNEDYTLLIPNHLQKKIDTIEIVISGITDTIINIHKDTWNLFFNTSNLKYKKKTSRINIEKVFADSILILRARVFNAIDTLNRRYKTFERMKLDDIIIKDESLRADASKKITQLLTTKTNLLASLTELEKNLGLENYQKIIDLLLNTKDKNSDTYFLSPEIQFNSPQQEISISVQPKEGFESFPGFEAKYVLPQLTHFSGLSYNLFVNTINNDALSTQIVSSDSTFIFVPEKNGKVQFGVSAMYHYGNRWGKSDRYHWHIAAGIGATFSEKIQPRILIGGGLAIGRTNKLMLTFGLSTGPVDKLSSLYKKDQAYSARPSDFLVRTIRTGGFISIGYTL